MPTTYPPDFEAGYREVFHTPDGVAIPKAKREAAKLAAFADWRLGREAGPQEDPIADPDDTPSEALEKIVTESLRTMTPADAIKHRAQLLKFAGDTVLQDRKAKIEKQSQASGLSMILELFQQVAQGKVAAGPGWIEATTLPTLSAREQAETAVEAGEALDGEEPHRAAQ